MCFSALYECGKEGLVNFALADERAVKNIVFCERKAVLVFCTDVFIKIFRYRKEHRSAAAAQGVIELHFFKIYAGENSEKI